MRHTQLHGLYISLAQALLGQNAYASSAHSCQMGIKRGRKPAEGELEDLSRTTRWRRENQSKRTPSEERSFKQAEVDRVQASYRLSCQVARTPAGSPEAAKQLSAVHRHLSTRRALAASGLHALLGAACERILRKNGFCLRPPRKLTHAALCARRDFALRRDVSKASWGVSVRRTAGAASVTSAGAAACQRRRCQAAAGR